VSVYFEQICPHFNLLFYIIKQKIYSSKHEKLPIMNIYVHVCKNINELLAKIKIEYVFDQSKKDKFWIKLLFMSYFLTL